MFLKCSKGNRRTPKYNHLDLHNFCNFETKNMQNSKKEENQKKGKPRNSAPKLKFSYKEEREYETIEDDIAALEEKADELEQEIVKCATDFVRLNELTKEKEEVDTALLEKMERWEYLEELAAKIKAQNT